MSSGSVERENTGIVAFMVFMFFGILALCGVEFADNAAKNELLPKKGHSDH